MNPLTNVKNITKLNEVELDRGLVGKSSWHDMYKDSAWVFIGGLAYGITEGDVLAVFSQYGEIVNINMVRDKKTGKIKGFCFLCYANQKSTVLAVDNFNGIKLCGRTIRVDHVANYRIPKEHENDDEVTKALVAEGCAPKAVKLEPPETVPKHTAEEKKEKKKKKAKKKKVKSSSSSSSSSETSDSETAIPKSPVKKEKYDPGYEKHELGSRHAPSQGGSHTAKHVSRKRQRHESSASDDSQEHKQLRHSTKDACRTGSGSTHKVSSKSSYHRQSLSKDRSHERSDTDSEDGSHRTHKKHSESGKNSRKPEVPHSERDTRHSEYKQGKSRTYEEQHYSHKQHKSDSSIMHRRRDPESDVSSVSSSSKNGIKDVKYYSKSKHKHSDIQKRQEHSDRRNEHREYAKRHHGQEKYKKKKHSHHSSSEDDFDEHRHYSSSSQKQKYSSHSKSRG